MKIEDVYKTIDVIITAQKKARQNNDYNTILLNAEALLEYLPGLINYSVTQEKEYRKEEARLANENDQNGKKNSGAYCETQAKATDFYTEWQRSKQFIELVYELVNMSKKLAGSVDKEYNASIK